MNMPRPIPCDQVVDRLWEYIDGELSDGDASRMRMHLDECARCFPHYDFQRTYRESVARAADQPMPPELKRRIFEAILLEESQSVVASAGSARRAPGGEPRSWWKRVFGRG
jgi:anti-sigma factor (TIGR02949 family)